MHEEHVALPSVEYVPALQFVHDDEPADEIVQNVIVYVLPVIIQMEIV